MVEAYTNWHECYNERLDPYVCVTPMFDPYVALVQLALLRNFFNEFARFLQ